MAVANSHRSLLESESIHILREAVAEAQTKAVRFRTLGCWAVTGAIESIATDLAAVVDETLCASSSERQGRISDGEDGGSLEQKKREGHF